MDGGNVATSYRSTAGQASDSDLQLTPDGPTWTLTFTYVLVSMNAPILRPVNEKRKYRLSVPSSFGPKANECRSCRVGTWQQPVALGNAVGVAAVRLSPTLASRVPPPPLAANGGDIASPHFNFTSREKCGFPRAIVTVFSTSECHRLSARSMLTSLVTRWLAESQQSFSPPGPGPC